MALKVHNTLTRKEEEFVPLSGKKVKMFVCGPTVYDYPHIGHAKTYIAFDVIARYLRYRGYDLEYVQNITDIDDKIIKRGNEAGKGPLELSDEFTKVYYADMKALHVGSVSKYVKASEVVPEIIGQAKALEEKGYAYQAGGNVYYSISRFADYGKLSHRKPDEAIAESRLDEDPYKREPFDFVIWKAAKPNEPTWDSPWGKGRPGWHIEDTAISIKSFGDQYDIHGGGEDLIFPHHEAEIAIAEAFTGKAPFVKYWMHSSFLKVEGSKMSKSLKNFLTIREAVEKYGADLVKFYFATTPYYRPVDYSDEHITDARKSMVRIRNTIKNLKFLLEKGVSLGQEEPDVSAYRQRFIAAMDNNFNTADAAAVMFDFIREANAMISGEKLKGREKIAEMLELLDEWSGVFGVPFLDQGAAELPPEIAGLMAEREASRKAKDWKRSDEIRDLIREKGWHVDDTADGPMARKL